MDSSFYRIYRAYRVYQLHRVYQLLLCLAHPIVGSIDDHRPLHAAPRVCISHRCHRWIDGTSQGRNRLRIPRGRPTASRWTGADVKRGEWLGGD